MSVSCIAVERAGLNTETEDKTRKEKDGQNKLADHIASRRYVHKGHQPSKNRGGEPSENGDRLGQTDSSAGGRQESHEHGEQKSSVKVEHYGPEDRESKVVESRK